MAKERVVLLCSLVFVSQLWAQPAAPQESTFQVSSAQPWTDTALTLQPGDVVKISASPTDSGAGACDPKGSPAASHTSELPLPSAPVGALIARLHGEGSVPVLVGVNGELKIEDVSHLFLGMNGAATTPCQGGFAVKVQKTTGSAAAAAETKTRGAELKSQLSNAAQVFLQGQFGIGKDSKTESGSSSAASSGDTAKSTAAPVLKNVSTTPLDANLRKGLDGLPRRVNDELHNLGDMVNFVIVGSQKDLQAALGAASWHVADTGNSNAVVNAIMQTYDKKDYLAMPMSTLFLFGRKQDYGYEMAEPIAMVASRHHFRIWKAPFTWKGQDVWVGAGTHDIGFAKDKRNNNVTHKIDPAVDGERDNIGSSLQKADKVKSLTYYLPKDPVQDAKNATGDEYHSDGRLLLIFLR